MFSTSVADTNPVVETPVMLNLTTTRLCPELWILSKLFAPSFVLSLPSLRKLSALTRKLPDTVTVKLQLAWLLFESVAVQVTVVVPKGKVEPDGGAHIAVAPGQLSFTVGAGYVTTFDVCPGEAVVLTLAGQTIEGGVLSIVMVTSALDEGQGGLEIVHRTTIGPAPPV